MEDHQLAGYPIIGKYGRPLTMTLFFFLQTVLFPALTYGGLGVIVSFIMIALAGFFYGSALALYPAVTGDFFGLKYLSKLLAGVHGMGYCGINSAISRRSTSRLDRWL